MPLLRGRICGKVSISNRLTFLCPFGQDARRSAVRCSPVLRGDPVGDTDAFWALHAALDEVRVGLGQLLGRRHARGFEIAYVVYPSGGFYQRHMDSLAGVDPVGTGRRSVSFICYLTEPGWQRADGGALRVWEGSDSRNGGVTDGAKGPEHSTGYPENECRDLLPESGSVVLFDSKLVWHEVLPTKRERACVVGWFLWD